MLLVLTYVVAPLPRKNRSVVNALTARLRPTVPNHSNSRCYFSSKNGTRCRKAGHEYGSNMAAQDGTRGTHESLS
jgi:hypothetical protein